MKVNFLSKFFYVGLLLGLGVACSSGSEQGSTADKRATAPATEKPVPADPEPQPAATSGAAKEVRETVEELFEICQNGDFSQAAALLVYRGDDPERKWKSPMNYEKESERLDVNKRCAQLQVLLTGLKSHEFLEFFQETESEGEWNIWTMAFEYEDGTREEQSLAFLRVDQAYLLGDID